MRRSARGIPTALSNSTERGTRTLLRDVLVELDRLHELGSDRVDRVQRRHRGPEKIIAMSLPRISRRTARAGSEQVLPR